MTKITTANAVLDRVAPILTDTFHQILMYNLWCNVLAITAFVAVFGYPTFMVWKAFIRNVKKAFEGKVIDTQMFYIQGASVLLSVVLMMVVLTEVSNVIQILAFPKLFLYNYLMR